MNIVKLSTFLKSPLSLESKSFSFWTHHLFLSSKYIVYFYFSTISIASYQCKVPKIVLFIYLYIIPVLDHPGGHHHLNLTLHFQMSAHHQSLVCITQFIINTYVIINITHVTISIIITNVIFIRFKLKVFLWSNITKWFDHYWF